MTHLFQYQSANRFLQQCTRHVPRPHEATSTPKNRCQPACLQTNHFITHRNPQDFQIKNTSSLNNAQSIGRVIRNNKGEINFRMASMVSHEQAPSMLNRIDRLDVMLGHLEQIHGGRKSNARSPATSTNSSGLLTGSDFYAGGDSSVTSSPRSLSRRRCRSMQEAMVEMQVKGTLFDRIDFLENRILKLEDEIEMERKESDGWGSPKDSPRGLKRENDGWRSPKASPGKGLKRLVKSCVKGGSTKIKE